jgi:hypothetical protein
MLLDLEELWPPAKSLWGLKFATVEDFERCEALAWEQPDSFFMANRQALMIEIRKTDLHLGPVFNG